MATHTTNYNLSKPEATDTQKSFIDDYCNNMDIIDANLGGGGGGDSVSWTQVQASGTKIAEITINGTTQNVYAPNGGGGGGSTSFRIIITGEAGETITATQGGTTYTATETISGVYVVDVDAVGTWTISNGVDSVTVDVGVYTTTLNLIPDGATVTPTDDVSIWLACGGRTEQYTTIAEVLSDSTCLSALISDNNAVDYLVRSITWASTITADSTAMSLIGLDNYASNTLLGNTTWRGAICTSAYFESVLNLKVPYMTSNTTPSGTVSAKNSYSSAYAPYLAFQDISVVSNGWCPTINNNSWIEYDFGDTVDIYRIDYRGFQWNTSQSAVAKGSMDDLTFDNIENLTDPLSQTSNIMSINFPKASYRYFRIDGNRANTSGYKFQFYGREDV